MILSGTRRVPALVLPFALAALMPARAAPADPKSSALTIDHETVFVRGLKLFDQQDYLGAITVWENLLASLGPERGWKMLYNLGLAYQAVGDPTSAVERYQAFVRHVGDQPAPVSRELGERRDDASARVVAIKAAYGAVHVTPPRSGEAILVRVGATPARAAGFTVYLAPGSHAIEIGAGTARARRIEVKVVAGSSVEIDANERAAAAPSVPVATTRATPPAPPPPKFPTFWVLAGVGATVASAALPIVLEMRAARLRDEAAKLGEGHTAYAAAVSDFEGARTAYYASFAAPIALLAVTLSVPIVHALRSSAPDPKRPTLSIDLRACQGGAACVEGRF